MDIENVINTSISKQVASVFDMASRFNSLSGILNEEFIKHRIFLSTNNNEHVVCVEDDSKAIVCQEYFSAYALAVNFAFNKYKEAIQTKAVDNIMAELTEDTE